MKVEGWSTGKDEAEQQAEERKQSSLKCPRAFVRQFVILGEVIAPDTVAKLQADL